MVFPIVQILKHKKGARETQQALAAFDVKQLEMKSSASASLVTRSTNSKKGKMYSMESLDDCLATNHDGLQIYASCMELNGENIIFLTKVLQFRKQFYLTKMRTHDGVAGRKKMFRAALSIYVQLVHTSTASYPINIESPIYSRLESIFGPATGLLASTRRASEAPSSISVATPWDAESPCEPPDSLAADEFPMHAMPSRPVSRSNESSENLTASSCHEFEDPLSDTMVPDEFDDEVFDAAYKSIRYMIWTETWQRYMVWKRSSSPTVA